MASNLYWLIILGNIREFLVMVDCFAIITMIFCLLVIFLTEDKDTKHEVKKMAKSVLRKVSLCVAILTLFVVFTPSKKEMILIGTVKAVESNENIGTLMDKGLNVLDKTFEKIYEEGNSK